MAPPGSYDWLENKRARRCFVSGQAGWRYERGDAFMFWADGAKAPVAVAEAELQPELIRFVLPFPPMGQKRPRFTSEGIQKTVKGRGGPARVYPSAGSRVSAGTFRAMKAVSPSGSKTTMFAHPDPAYDDWMKLAVAFVEQVWQGRWKLPKIGCLTVVCYSPEARGDLDKMFSSVQDALVKAGVVSNDHVAVIDCIASRWVRSAQAEMWVEILT